MSIAKLLMFEEGFRADAYYCSEGYPTIGIGWKIGIKNQSLDDFKLMTINEGAALAQCNSEAEDLATSLSCIIINWKGLSEPRQAILISMAYQMGLAGLMKFENMIAAIEDDDFPEASNQGMDSIWASDRQTPERAYRHMRVMLAGNWNAYANYFKSGE
jgi:lysozyme